jgi:hypothetical protein
VFSREGKPGSKNKSRSESMGAIMRVSRNIAFCVCLLLISLSAFADYESDSANDFAAAEAQDTISAWESFVQEWPGGSKYYYTACERLLELRYQKALDAGTLEGWSEFCGIYKVGSNATIEKARGEMERLLYERITEKPDIALCERYLTEFPGGTHRDRVISLEEPLLFAQAKELATVEAYKNYLLRFPAGFQSEEVRRMLDLPLFEEASKQDWHTAYEDYLKMCPNGQKVAEAEKRLKYLKSNPAVVECDFPKIVELVDSVWRWKTTFKETGGKTGFKVKGSGYFLDANGNRWVLKPVWAQPVTPMSRGEELIVPAGGSVANEWFNGTDNHRLCHTVATFTWEGEDAGGHPIKIEESVFLMHTGCPRLTEGQPSNPAPIPPRIVIPPSAGDQSQGENAAGKEQ